MKVDLVEVGAVRKTHGYQGEMKLTVYEGFEDDVEAADFFFIGKTPDRAIPYEVDEIRGADWIVRLDGVSDKEAAAAIRGQSLYLKADQITSPQHLEQQAAADKFSNLVGFEMHDVELGKLGQVREILTYPQQVLAGIDYKGATKLVPLNAHYIRGIDYLGKVVSVELPEGLLDL